MKHPLASTITTALASFALVSSLLSATAHAQSTPAAGSFAPPGRWATNGGGAARSGLSLAAPIRTEPIEDWQVTLRGPIEGEPRVADGLVFVCAREAKTRRALQVLELATGATRLHQVLPANIPLEPAVWADHVAVRPEENRVDVYRVRAQRLMLVRSLRAKESISPPLFVDGELYVRVDDELHRYDLDRRAALWASDAGTFRGTPSVRGAGVYCVRYDERGNALVTVLSRANGEVLSEAKAGHHGGDIPTADEDASLFVLDDTVFLHYPRPVPTTTGTELSYGRIGHETDRLDERAGGLNAILAAPIAWNNGWIALDEDGDAPRWTYSRNAEGGVEVTVLADATNHPELTAASVPASRTGAVVYLGGIAADLTTSAILWKRAAPLFRPVPAGGYLLVVEEERTITALREPDPARSPAGQRVVERAKEIDAKVTEGFALLAYQSLRLGDATLTARLLEEAIRRGAQGRTVDSARDGLERIAKGRPKQADARRVAGIEEEERGLRTTPARELFDAARSSNDPALQRGFLRAALERDPTHEEAIAGVRSAVPRGAPMGSTFDALSWLDLIDTMATTPIDFAVPRAGRAPSPEIERLTLEANEWRTDVNGYRTERLFVIAPPDYPGAVARCLEVGEFVCDILETMFDAEHEPGGDPMTMILYESREEYIGESRRGRSGPELALGWTAGHYSSAENISRVYVPEDDREFDRLLSVYAHEMTHHWLATRAPFANRFADPKFPYWIVEGIATLVEEFVLDVRTRTWKTKNPRASSLDVVANADGKELLPWSSLVALDHDAFNRLGREGKTTVSLAWHLGVRAEQSQTQLFYAQSGALCHYLFNSTAENRKRLIDYVAAWYRHDEDKVDAQTAFGDLGALGRAAHAYARETVGD